MQKHSIYALLFSAASIAHATNPPAVCETPASISCIYGLTAPVPGCPVNGTSQISSRGWGAIAVVEALDNPNTQSDLNVFAAQFGLPPTNIIKIYSAAAPANFPLASGCPSELPFNPAVPLECTLDPSKENPCDEHVADSEWAYAMAPGATIIMVEAPSDNIKDKLYAVCYAAKYVEQYGGGGVSMSWSVPEMPGETRYDAIFQGYPNIVFVASSGDYSAPANYPSASPFVISAGGTSIVRNAQGNFVTETAWSTVPKSKPGSKNGGSGGPSVYEPRPFYQNSVMKVVGNARGTPDISFDADPQTGVCVYSSLHAGAAWFADGGTSLAAPGLSGIINSAGHKASSTIDELNFIYTSAIKNYHTNWHDIIAGNNGYLAMAGYDFTTGLGSPKGYGGK